MDKSNFKSRVRDFFGKLLSVFSLIEERNVFFQNLALLIKSGTPLSEALRIIIEDLQSYRMKRAAKVMLEDIEDGGKFWKALDDHRYIFSEYEIRMVKIAEETGSLYKSLEYLSTQLGKDTELRGKIRGALFYPVTVLVFASVIGTGISWFVLPKLARAFASLRIQLPIATQILIKIGDFINSYGYIVFPSLAVLAFILFLAFRFTRLKFVGLRVIEVLPGVGGFLRRVRTARLSLFFGTLLEAGVPIVETLESMVSIVEMPREKRFFKQLLEHIEMGESFEKSFSEIKEAKTLFPKVTQQMIFTGEKSGRLPEIFLYISDLYEKKVDLESKNLTQTLEPILLVLIALVVAFIAIAIILPIYSLLGGLQSGSPVTGTPPPPIEEVREAPTPAPAGTPEGPKAEAPKEAVEVKAEKKVKVLDTPIGYLNVRAGPGTFYKFLRRANPGEIFEYTTIEDGWYRIIEDNGAAGWVLEKYVEIVLGG